ncbi:uncharacterized protein LOC126687349 [Mercurialis annua]|uniref:uncharacterized protein LOC126687349 n=1 Tax=Mercurialis annua TaxID=3986 RepID=UPI00215F2959|nr:uncharacterized protein LOC126687349 [Mercurialis annua]
MIVLGEPEGCGNVDEGSDSSEYAGSDKLYSCSDSEEEGEVAYKPRFEEFNEDTDMDDIHFAIGMQFSSFDQFKKVVRHYGIKHRYVINFRPNTKKRCKAFCKRQCPFYLWASLMSGDKETVQIKTGILEHSCVRDHNIRHINPTWIAHHYLEQFRADPTWKLDGIVQAVKLNQKAEIYKVKALRAKNIALNILDGDDTEQISMLHDYRLELMRTHPGSSIMFKQELGVFKGMYVCLAPLREGFRAGCRSIISIDGCWLKGIHGGQLLAAVGIDANDCIYPVAWAIVDNENKENWLWFLRLLAEDLDIRNSYHWCFMSDRQKMKTSSRSLHEYAADNEVIKKTKSLHELLCLNPQAAGPSRQKTSKSQAARKAPAKRYKTSVPTPSRAANSAQGPTNSAQGPTNSVANPAPIPAPAPPRSLLKLKAPIPPKATSSSNVSSKKKRVWIPPGFGDKTN